MYLQTNDEVQKSISPLQRKLRKKEQIPVSNIRYMTIQFQISFLVVLLLAFPQNVDVVTLDIEMVWMAKGQMSQIDASQVTPLPPNLPLNPPPAPPVTRYKKFSHVSFWLNPKVSKRWI